MNRKLFVSAFLTLVVVVGTVSVTLANIGHQPQTDPAVDHAAASGTAPGLFVDGLLLAGPNPILEHDTTLLPLRATSEAIGAGVEWDPLAYAATVRSDSVELVIRPNSVEAVRNGHVVPLEAPTRLVGGRLFVPAGFLADTLGLDLHLVPEQNAVALMSGVPKVYVANEYADTVSVINATTNQKIKDIKLELPHTDDLTAEMKGHSEGGKGDGEDHKDAKVIPHNIQVAPDGRYVYTANAGTNSLGVIDAYTDTVVAQIPVGEHPAHVVITADGRTAFVTNGGEATVSVVDLKSRRVTATLPVGEKPHGLRITPDGREVYVANTGSDSVSVIDVGSLQTAATVKVISKPAQVGFTPDGKEVYVSNTHLGEEVTGHISVIATATRQVTAQIPVGRTPIQMYATPDGKWVYVANTGTGDVSVIDTARHAVAKTIPAGNQAHGVVVSGDGRFVYVSNTGDGTVTVIDTNNQEVIATVPADAGSNGISFRAGR